MTKLSKGKRVSGEQRHEVQQSFVERYQAGESIRSLAVDSGRSYGFVQALLKDAGVVFRTRGGSHRATRTKETSEDQEDLTGPHQGPADVAAR